MDKELQAKFERKLENKRVKYLIKREISIARIEKEHRDYEAEKLKADVGESIEKQEEGSEETDIQTQITKWASTGWDTLSAVYESITTLEDEPKVEFVPGVTRVIIDGDNTSKKMRKPIFKALTINRVRENNSLSRRSSISSVRTNSTVGTSVSEQSSFKSPDERNAKIDLLTSFIDEFAEKAHLFECTCYITGALNKSRVSENGGRITIKDTHGADDIGDSTFSNHSSLSIIRYVRSVMMSNVNYPDELFHHVFVTSNKRLIKWLRIVGVKNIIKVKHWLHVANKILLVGSNEEDGTSYSRQDKIKMTILLKNMLSKEDTADISDESLAQLPISISNGNVIMEHDDDLSTSSDGYYDDYFSEEPGLDSVVKEMKNELEDSNCVLM